MKANYHKVSVWLLFFSFMLVTISLTKTNPSHEEVVNKLRIGIGLITIALLFFDIIFTIIVGRLSKTRLYILLLGFFLLSYATIGSFIYGGVRYFLDNPELVVLIFISIIFLWASSAVGGEISFAEIDKFFRKFIPLYCFATLFITIYFGGLSLSFPPKFIFNELGINSYSQGISKLYMIASLLSLISFIKEKKKRFMLVSFFFLCASFLGGARGDFAIGFILYSFIIMSYNKKLGVYLILITAIISSLSFINLSDLSEKFYIVNRFLQLDSSNLGQRDVLARQAIALLDRDSFCMISGCGFNAFQYFWNYRVGLYPHNIMIESFITLGFPIASVVILSYLYGLLKSIQTKMILNGFVIIGVYLVAIGMKSGTIIDLTLVSFVLNMIITTIFKNNIADNHNQDPSTPSVNKKSYIH